MWYVARSRRRALASFNALALGVFVATSQAAVADELVTLLRAVGERSSSTAEMAEFERTRAEVLGRAEEYRPRAFELLANDTLAEDRSTEGRRNAEILTGSQRDLLMQLLLAGRPARLRAHVLDVVTGDAEVAARRAALTVLARVGLAEDLDGARRIAGVDDPAGSPLAREFEAAVGGILGRDPAAAAALRVEIRDVDEGVRLQYIRGVGRSGSAHGLELLASACFDDDPQAAAILDAVAELASAMGGPFGERELGLAERMLWSSDPLVVEAAVHAAVALADPRFVERLVDLLDEPAARSRAAAARGLAALSGRSYGTDAGLWRRWYARELAWWSGSWPETRRLLEVGGRVELARALADVAPHRLFRGETMPHVLPLTWSEDATVRRLACSSLAELGAIEAAPELVDALEDSDAAVAAAAGSALRRLTGAPHESVEAWRVWLDARADVTHNYPQEMPR